MFQSSILMIGCGGLGKCLLELNLVCGFIPKTYRKKNMKNIIIIEPNNLSFEEYPFLKKYNIKHIQISLTKENIKDILNKLIPNNIIVLDVSIGINALEVVKICNRYNVMYVNTSLENWEIDNPAKLKKSSQELYPRTLYYQYTRLMSIKRKIKTTMVFDHGMNPGLISHLAKIGILSSWKYLTKNKDKDFSLSSLTKKNLSTISKNMGLRAIHIAELDTQKLKKGFKFQKDTFYNTWSGAGMIAESIDPIQVGYSPLNRIPKQKDINDLIKVNGFTPKEGKKNVKYYPIRGIERKTNTIILDPKGNENIIKGYLIPHGEANTLSNYLKDSKSGYNPNVYYVYHPSEPTIKSIEILKSRNYTSQPKIYRVLNQTDLDRNGYDSIGAHLIFGENVEWNWWTGTILTIKDVRKLGMKYAGPTETQVAISYLACIRWMLRNTKKGICSPEDLPSELILKWCMPYLGTFFNKPIRKTNEIF